MNTEQIAFRMFARNAAQYGDAAMIELAWADPEIRSFWLAEAEAVVADIHTPARQPQTADCHS